MMRRCTLTVLVVLTALIAACAAASAGEETAALPTQLPPTATQPPPSPLPATPEPTPVPAEVPTTTPTEAGPPPLPEPQRIEFEAEDGTPLVGIYYPPAVGPVTGVLLMHQMGADKSIWEVLITALRGGEGAVQPGRSYAVFAFDFPEHGESGGAFSDQAALAAARAALALMRTLEGVDPGRIVLIGASIGADASVDECKEGCVGAVPISPGSWLGINYQQALTDLRAQNDPPVLCIASEEDGPSPATCQSGEAAGLSDYRVHLYDGRVHGNFLFFEENLTPPPPILDLIMGWLAEHVPLP